MLNALTIVRENTAPQTYIHINNDQHTFREHSQRHQIAYPPTIDAKKKEQTGARNIIIKQKSKCMHS